MKTIIISSIFAATFLFGSMGSIFAATPKIYKNVNETGNTTTTEIYTGEQDINITPVAKHVVKCDENGNPEEKITYQWNPEKRDWEAQSRYTYYHDFQGNLNALEYAKWDGKSNQWEIEPYLTMYIQTNEGDLLTINE